METILSSCLRQICHVLSTNLPLKVIGTYWNLQLQYRNHQSLWDNKTVRDGQILQTA